MANAASKMAENAGSELIKTIDGPLWPEEDDSEDEDYTTDDADREEEERSEGEYTSSEGEPELEEPEEEAAESFHTVSHCTL
jgi:hypothetical protein